jgi:hypothetical protein
MSPEQIDGSLLDPRSDLFSLGCVFYAMVTGQSPFYAVHPLEVARRVREHVPPPLHELDPTVPAFFSSIVSRLLEKRPQDRYASADEVGKILTARLAEANLGYRALPVRGSEKKGVRARPGLWLGAAAAFVVLLGALTLALLAARWGWATKTDSLADTVITVGALGRHRTLQDALAHAGPGSTIRLLDQGTYQGPIVLQDAQQYRDLSIEAPQQATVENASSQEPVLSVTEVPGLRLSGLRLRARNQQHAVSVRGRCDGLTLTGVAISQPQGSPFAAIVLWPGATGSREKPIQVSDVDIRCGSIGIAVIGSPEAPASWIAVEKVPLQRLGRFPRAGKGRSARPRDRQRLHQGGGRSGLQHGTSRDVSRHPHRQQFLLSNRHLAELREIIPPAE